MPYYVPRTKFRKAYPPEFRNTLWEGWGPLGRLIGYPLILFGIALSVCEVIRILYGPTNRGITNYDTASANFPAHNQGLLFRFREGITPFRVEKFHYWPWTYAANLFGAVIIAAGVTGVISAYRRSYSSLFAFLALSLLSALLSGYLIGYFSILTNYYISRGLNVAANRPDSMDTSFGLIGTNLAFSIASCLFSIIGAIAAFLGIKGCTPKGLGYQSVATGPVGAPPSAFANRPPGPFPQNIPFR